jgi:hypothetical protein
MSPAYIIGQFFDFLIICYGIYMIYKYWRGRSKSKFREMFGE